MRRDDFRPFGERGTVGRTKGGVMRLSWGAFAAALERDKTFAGVMARVAVASVAVVGAVMVPMTGRAEASLPSAQTGAFLDSEPGETLGNGQQLVFNSVTYQFVYSATFDLSGGGPDTYQVSIILPKGNTTLATGVYDTALYSDATHAGLFIDRDGRQLCGSAAGRLEIDDVTYAASGDVQTFSARFEDHCNGETPALFGAISYNSTADYRTRTISSNSIVVDTVGATPASGSVTITNHGPSTLTPSGFSISGSNAAQFALTANTCTSTLSAGSACTVTVRYRPSQTNRVQETATLSFFDELAPQGPAGEPATVGTGRDIALIGNRATVSVSPTSASFGYGRVGDYNLTPTRFTVTNHGGVPVTLSGIYSVGGNYYDWFGNSTCGNSLAARASCTIAVYFAPTRLGVRHSTLVVYDNAVGGAQSASLSGTGTEGYYLAGAAGEVGNFGDADYYGNLTNVTLNAPIVSITTTNNGAGYWLLGKDGGIFSFGNAHFYGSTGGIRLNQPVLGMARTHDGAGYWLVASDGGIFSFGDARFYGSTGNVRLNEPIVGMAPTPTGKGYWLVASDGGIFSFGDARFYGSTGNTPLSKPILSMAATPTGHGYWFVASDGGVFCFGDAAFFGSLGGQGISDVIGMAATSPPLSPFLATHAVALTPGMDRGALTGRSTRPYLPAR
jgi:hypothetical protein